MTDRIRALTVALETDVRTDDVQALVSAISQLRGVLTVATETPVSPNDYVTEQRIRRDYYLRLQDVLFKAP